MMIHATPRLPPLFACFHTPRHTNSERTWEYEGKEPGQLAWGFLPFFVGERRRSNEHRKVLTSTGARRKLERRNPERRFWRRVWRARGASAAADRRVGAAGRTYRRDGRRAAVVLLRSVPCPTAPLPHFKRESLHNPRFCQGGTVMRRPFAVLH